MFTIDIVICSFNDITCKVLYTLYKIKIITIVFRFSTGSWIGE